MNTVTLLIGGNQGDREGLIGQAIELIRQRIGSVAAASQVYETEPWGDFGDEHPLPFLNQALLVHTALTARQVLCQALAIEAELGRQRPEGQSTQATDRQYHSRPMDIDIIFYDDQVIDESDLVVPHPRMHLRRFVLEPLADIMPHYRHPLLNKTITQLLNET